MTRAKKKIRQGMKGKLLLGLASVFSALSVLLIAQCARFPAVPPALNKRIRITFFLDGPVNPNYVYIVALNDANDASGANGGPLPVVAPPWGNGFVAGRATHFVRYDGFQPNGGYSVNRFTDLQNLLSWVFVGVPVNFTTPTGNSNKIEFELDFSQLRPPPDDPNAIFALQVNLLTMDRVPTNPGDTNPKFWDALGDSTDPGSINDFITIDTTQSRIYRNSDSQLEPQGDAPDPGLDIIDWQIEVRLP
ncbi:MAG: hypothetical protein AKCLJLPJ_02153 [Fimbriimonadales bacterium]|nr:hypothetical protein [Fimbriimonadales bacterium]